MRMDNNRIPEEQNYGDLKRQDFTVSNFIQKCTRLSKFDQLLSSDLSRKIGVIYPF